MDCSCIICRKKYSHKGIHTHYMRSHMGISFSKIEECKCDLCGKQFNTKQAIIGHKARAHNPERQREFGAKGNAKKRQMESNGYVFSHLHTEETKEKLSIIACERLSKHSKYSKNFEYKPGVILESTYEVRVAEILDLLNIEWVKVRQGYIWNDNGKRRRYIPDFYLPKQNVFLDPKNNYLIKKDKKKIESAMKLNNITVIVLADDMINKEFLELLLL